LADGKNRFTLIVLLCVLSGVYLFVFSDSGLLERMNLERKNRELLANIGKLRGEKSSLEESLRSYEAGRVPDRDVLNAGMVGGGDRLVFLDDRGQKTAMETRKEKKRETFSIDIIHYRILWVVLSILVLLFYFSRKKHGEEVSGDV